MVTDGLLDGVRARAEASAQFASVRVEGARLIAVARDVEQAEYRLDALEDALWVSVVTSDRWLSESVETELLHTGDKIEELIEDELVELDVDHGRPKVEHFRSEDLLFTFRSPVPVGGLDAGTAEQLASTYLLAYEACFRQLGDMDGSDEED